MTKPYGNLEFIYQNRTIYGEERYVVKLKGYQFYLYSPSSDKNIHANGGMDFYHMPLRFMDLYVRSCPICGERTSFKGQQSICKKNLKLNIHYSIKKELNAWNFRSSLYPIVYPPIALKKKIFEETEFFR